MKQFSHNKKGIAFSMTLTIILSLISLFVITGVLYALFFSLDFRLGIEDMACKFTLSVKTWLSGLDNAINFPLACKTTRFVLDEDYVNKVKDSEDSQKEGVVRAVADSMVRCRRVFEGAHSRKILLSSKDCYLCSAFSVEDTSPVTSTEIKEFLYTKVTKSGKGYLHVLLAPYRSSGPHDFVVVGEGIQSGKEYAIVYSKSDAKELGKQFSVVGSHATLALITGGPKLALGVAVIEGTAIAFDQIFREDGGNKIILVPFSVVSASLHSKEALCTSYVL